jgi:hypothetical protein
MPRWATPKAKVGHAKHRHRPQGDTRMRLVIACAALLSLSACASWGPVSPQQRAEAATDVPEDHPHPPGRIVSSPADPQGPLRCWDNGEDTVCKRSLN